MFLSEAKQRQRFYFKPLYSGLAVALSIVAFTWLLLLLTAPGTAHAQNYEVQQLRGQINQLEKQIQTLSRAVYRGETPPPGATGAVTGGAYETNQLAGYEVRLTELEGQMRYLTGEIERQGHAVRQVQSQVERALADMEARLNVLERGGARYNNATPQSLSNVGLRPQETYVAPNNTGRPMTLGGNNTAEREYEQAFALVRDAQYQEAQLLFRGFLDRYPEHSLSSNAHYWLGETYYVQGDYPQAAKIFAQGYQKFPKSPKGADYLLKLGLSLARMDKTTDACLSFQQLEKEFGKTAGNPVIQRAQQEARRLRCQ